MRGATGGVVIDEHRHIGYASSRPARLAEDIVRELDQLGVGHAVIVAGDAKPATREEELAEEKDTYPIVEEYLHTGRLTPDIECLHRQVCDQSLVFKALKARNGRLLGGYILNPWLVGAEFDRAREAVREYGLRYIKLHPWMHAFAPDDRTVMGPVVELALELDVPLWVHASYGPGTEPERIARLAKEFPAAKVIMGHACCGGDAEKVAEIVRAHESLWVDLAEATEQAMRRVIEAVPEDRTMLASDDPWGFPLETFSLQAQMEKVRSATEGKPHLRRRIMGENAAQLLKIGR